MITRCTTNVTNGRNTATWNCHQCHRWNGLNCWKQNVNKFINGSVVVWQRIYLLHHLHHLAVQKGTFSQNIRFWRRSTPMRIWKLSIKTFVQQNRKFGYFRRHTDKVILSLLIKWSYGQWCIKCFVWELGKDRSDNKQVLIPKFLSGNSEVGKQDFFSFLRGAVFANFRRKVFLTNFWRHLTNIRKEGHLWQLWKIANELSVSVNTNLVLDFF